MTQLKKHQIVMLPTEKAEDCLYLQNGKLNYHKGYLTQEYLKYSLNAKSYHLYILSDEEIKEGDWFMDITPMNYGKIYQSVGFSKSKGYEHWIKSTIGVIKEPIIQCKKIIATRDTSLKILCNKCEGAGWMLECKNCNGEGLISLPQPSTSFIQKYIEEYNKGNVITDVMVEYEGIEWLDKPLKYFPKINLKDNTITIRPIKNNWTREEVIELCKKAYKDSNSTGLDKKTLELESNDWIEENL